jgi:hypothetical protein
MKLALPVGVVLAGWDEAVATSRVTSTALPQSRHPEAEARKRCPRSWPQRWKCRRTPVTLMAVVCDAHRPGD